MILLKTYRDEISCFWFLWCELNISIFISNENMHYWQIPRDLLERTSRHGIDQIGLCYLCPLLVNVLIQTFGNEIKCTNVGPHFTTNNKQQIILLTAFLERLDQNYWNVPVKFNAVQKELVISQLVWRIKHISTKCNFSAMWIFDISRAI